MSKKSNLDEEKNPFLMVLYIIAVIVLTGCIVLLIAQSFKRKEAYEELVEQISAQEAGEDMISDAWAESEEEQPEGETVPEEETEENTELAKNEPVPEVTEAAPEVTEEAEQTPEGTPAPEVSAQPSEAAAADKNFSVLVLNGTGVEGVAGHWCTVLNAGGFTNTSPQNYTGPIEDQTVIYAADEAQGNAVSAQFPNSVVRVGTLQAPAGVTLPAVNVYVVIGKNDAVNQ